MTEDQPGVPLILDVGVIDMASCEPLPNALVAFWHCNATGSYASFTGRDPNTPFGELLEQLNITDFEIGKTDLHTDDTTWLRGMWPTNDEGILEMKTIFPGFYVERTVHIHTQVFMDWVLHTNGTVKTGDTNSIGQLYFNEDVSEQLMAMEPYVGHTEINRTTNNVDTIYAQGFENGYNPVVDIIPLDGKDVRNGVIGTPDDPTPGPGNELLFHLYYPTRDTKSQSAVPYFDTESAVIWNKLVQLPEGSLLDLTTALLGNASFLNAPTGHSTILFSPDGGVNAWMYYGLLAHWASRGYTIHNYRVDDLDAAISWFSAFVRKSHAPFDTSKFITIGHSIGGSASVAIAPGHPKVKAAVNLDGAFPENETVVTDVGRPVFLMSSINHTTQLDPSWAEFQEHQTDWWESVSIYGSGHLDYSDITAWNSALGYPSLIRSEFGPTGGGPPYLPRGAVLGLVPSHVPNVPISSVLVLVFILSAIVNMTILQLNLRRKHKFILSGVLFGFSMARMMANILRIAWTTHNDNARLVIAASIFANAGVLLLFVTNIILLQRIVRAYHPMIGWSKALGWVFRFLYFGIAACLVMVIVSVVYSYYTLEPSTQSQLRAVRLSAAVFLAVLSFLPIPSVIATLLLPRSSPIDQFGHGSMRMKTALLLFTATTPAVGRAKSLRRTTVMKSRVTVTL
ncbi:hypothetical protein QQZ08_004658 [Neonectria magnoliae]|uniref:Intradiol ring-cleavage dioxygenases domain-containing protein n=1 Tax=Neonectria magnoliae TaxID=2732573 RepID=A0ABR1I5Q2_9HYPO